MIAIIRTHNTLNGLRFVTAEFGLMIVLVVPFSLYFAIRGRWLLAFVGVGIVCNSVVVMVYAVRSLLSGEADVGIRALYLDPVTRRRVALAHPNLLLETLELAATTILPFVLTAAIGWELARGRASVAPPSR